MNHDYFNQKIECSVEKCKYYDAKEERCTLGSIRVAKEEAICESYQKKNEL